MTLLRKVASVLESIADEDDARPPVETRPDPLLERLEARSGSPLSQSVRNKLAQDEELRTVLGPIIGAPEAPRPLGEPSEKSAASTPMTKAERRQAAEDTFADTVMRHASR